MGRGHRLAVRPQAAGQGLRVRHRSGQPTHGVEHVAQRHHALVRYPACTGLESGDATVRRRHPHRTHGVGANGSGTQLRAHRCGAAATRAARREARAPRVVAVAVSRVGIGRAQGPFVHVELAQHHQPQAAQMLHHRRICAGAALAVSFCARTARPALHVHVVFDGDGQTVPRAQGPTLGPALLALTRHGQAARGVHPQVGMECGVVLGDARQVVFASGHRVGGALREALHPGANRTVEGVGGIGQGDGHVWAAVARKAHHRGPF